MDNGKCVANMNSTNSFPLWSLRSIRLRITVLLAIALCVEGLMRTNMNMAMNGDLLWTSQEQSWIFAAFYVGSLVVIFPGSYLCDWIGPAHTVQSGAIINIIGSMITPYISLKIGVTGVIVIRFLMGCGQGVLTPCMNVLIAHWFPLSEKSTAVALATTGNQLSIIFAMFITAELCQISLFGGWPAAFYLYSLLGIGLCFGWFRVVKDVPTRVKHITDAELTYITGSAHGRGQKRVIPLNVPWREILSSTAVWSTALSSFSQSFVVVGIVTYLPLYYRTILNMDLTSVSNIRYRMGYQWYSECISRYISTDVFSVYVTGDILLEWSDNNGVLSALPFICQLVTKLAFAGLADKAKEGRFSPNQVTKTCNLFASLGGACCFVALLFFDCNHRNKAVFLICLTMGILSGFVPGYNTSIVCIAPKYTSSVASFCRLWGTVGSISSPYIIGMITSKNVISEWRTVFIIMTCILTLTGAIFQLFGTVNEQEWARDASSISILSYMNSLNEKETDKTLKLELEKGV
ncbi:unnamed protein product [Onchocerca flexuosa]|uniref:MFS domain-containing protein n=1 Tax=Onchocerca flexuosa TaxID=387005 RepID=A0A183I3P2_9BILA|nr:unnamed protein product [Onchocerca flexuosa]